MIFRIGDVVLIYGRIRTLVNHYDDIPGGWIIDSPVLGFRSWNVSAMKMIKRKHKKYIGEKRCMY